MKFKKSLIAILVSSISLTWANITSAQEIRTLQDYLEQCIPESEDDELNPECDRLREANEANEVREDEELEAVDDSADQDNGIGGYAGINLGIFFPDIDESSAVFSGDNTDIGDAAFGSSIFAGISFSRYLATDIELGALIGDIDSDLDEDESYVLGTFFLNPRFSLPLGRDRQSVALFLSPGIGISQLISSVEDEVDDFDRTTLIEDDIRFTWQVKGGVSVPVSRRFSVLGQLRYASQTGDDAIDYFGAELGAGFNF
ncbi:MAG: outer membrane beta-barrel protein [Cyanobacteria bacterium J06631_6]